MNRASVVFGSAAATAAFALLPFAASAATVDLSGNVSTVAGTRDIIGTLRTDMHIVADNFMKDAAALRDTIHSWLGALTGAHASTTLSSVVSANAHDRANGSSHQSTGSRITNASTSHAGASTHTVNATAAGGAKAAAAVQTSGTFSVGAIGGGEDDGTVGTGTGTGEDD